MKTIAVALMIFLAACASRPLDESQLSDGDLVSLVEAAIARDLDLLGSIIKVGAINGTITLNGLVDTEKQRERATFVAQGVKGVRSVINDLQLRR